MLTCRKANPFRRGAASIHVGLYRHNDVGNTNSECRPRGAAVRVEARNDPGALYNSQDGATRRKPKLDKLTTRS